MGICSRDYRGALQPPPSLVPLPWLNNYLLWGPSGTPEIIIRYLTIVINHFRARWRVHFGYMLSFLLNFESPSSLPCAYSRCSLVSSSWSFCFFFSFSSRSFLFSISFEQNRVLAVLGLWKGDMCSKGCGLYFSKGFFIRNNYVGSGFQAELEASSRFILFFLSIISFPFFFIDSLACFYYSSRSGTIIEKVEKVAS